jgi:dihydrofolate reductase
MIISLIAAMSEDRVIGQDGKLPWHIPADLTHFKTLTMGHAVLMGRRTYESIGRPLHGRRNIVLSRTEERIEGCEIARSLPEAIAAAEGDEEIFICGGEQLFREALPLCQRIYLTIVHDKYRGDVRFPELPEGFVEMQREERQDLTPPISFLVFEKVGRIQAGAEDVQDLRKKGREAIQRQLYFLGRQCLEQALSMEFDPDSASDLAFCIAKSGGDLQQARQLAEKALQSQPHNIRFLLTLGRIEMMAGDTERALETLRKGAQLGGGQEFFSELAKLGARKPPPIKALPRNHLINRYIGLMLSRIGLR